MPKDIEDIVQLGKELHVCPYYATRNSIKQAEVSHERRIESSSTMTLAPARYAAVQSHPTEEC